MKIRALLAALAAVALPAIALAQAFPSKQVTIVLSYAAGGPTDFLARTLGEKVSARIGQPVLVDPKPGANERVATEYLLRQPADGYTTVLVALPHATNPAVFSSLPYDTFKEFIGMIHLVNIPVILTVKSDSPIKSFADFAAFAKAKPGEAMFGSPGALGQIRGGRVRAIGISSAQRVPVLPDVPTFAEQGHPEAVTATWFGLIVRSSTPREVVAKLNAEFNAALAMPDVKEKLTERGMTIVGGSPESYTAFIRAENERWAKVVKARGIKIE
jgi:tripartite-type tricarboxylate transporter receptor subunit TctC